MVRVIGVMLCGGNREGLIAEALESCKGNVDHWVLVDTGESAHKALHVAARTLSQDPSPGWTTFHTPEAWGYDVLVTNSGAVASRHKFPYAYNGDAAAGRNFALDCAAKYVDDFCRGETCYAMILDTDERMVYDNIDIREALAVVDTEVVEVMSRSGEYPKIRFIKLPAAHKYVDPVHEQYADADSISMLNRVYFWECDRSKEEQDQKMKYVLDIAYDWVAKDTKCARAWMHCGNAEIYFGRYDLAQPLFERCAQHSTHDEEKAWALFRAAECANELGNMQESIALCAESLAATPYFPEPCCLASLASYKLDRPFDAMAWSQLAIVLGETSPVKRITPMRTGFRLPRCHYEMPWDLRAMSLECLVDKGLPGMQEAHAQAVELRDKAIALRESRLK